MEQLWWPSVYLVLRGLPEKEVNGYHCSQGLGFGTKGVTGSKVSQKEGQLLSYRTPIKHSSEKTWGGGDDNVKHFVLLLTCMEFKLLKEEEE